MFDGSLIDFCPANLEEASLCTVTYKLSVPSAGFMMEMASWDGGISRTVQFLVPKVMTESFVAFDPFTVDSSGAPRDQWVI